MSQSLFKHNNDLITLQQFRETLQQFQADQCDVLYIHSGMQFGLPNIEIGRTRVLEDLASAIYALGVDTMLMPSYTFSFCNGEVFDKLKSPSSMGALNEYLRIRHEWERSKDPLMSNILYGKETSLIRDIGKNSVGSQSTFDLLTSSGLKVKFLFLGPRIHDCFTYMHYLESVMNVPYRYDFTFKGTIYDGDDKYADEYKLFIRDNGVEAGGGAKIYENMLIERGFAKFQKLGGGYITLVDLEPAKELYLNLLDLSPTFYIEEVFNEPTKSNDFVHRKMVAL